ncbi:MAG: hypothetical protein ACREAE_08600, partial [Nitrosopumilaceae archaeon]
LVHYGIRRSNYDQQVIKGGQENLSKITAKAVEDIEKYIGNETESKKDSNSEVSQGGSGQGGSGQGGSGQRRG